MNWSLRSGRCISCLAAMLGSISVTCAVTAAPVPGGSLDPLSIPKFVTPLTVPFVMPAAGLDRSTGAPVYNVEVVQFQQQILPKRDLRGNGLAPTTVWSYAAVGVGDTRKYPAYTFETRRNTPITVNWYNNLKDDKGRFLPHILPVDQTLHWANPDRANGCVDVNGNPDTTHTKDCRTLNPQKYTGPVPITTHVHGAHVQADSDGYPEAWYLPQATNIDCVVTYSCFGSQTNTYGSANTANGVAAYRYSNDQPSTTLWYHDHTLGMTRLNIYAGPAGFWLLRDSTNAGGETGLAGGVLPGPAPRPGDSSGNQFHEMPLLIQDRSFNADGSLFYPDNRAFFEGQPLPFPLISDGSGLPSDISPIWNPEVFFNVMVVNGASWPYLKVEANRYRFRLLNGSNSRFLNLAMFVVNANGTLTSTELPFYQIGGDQGLLPKVIKVSTGYATELPGNGKIPRATAAESPGRALLLAPAERADVIADFAGIPSGTRVRLINTAPDSPFGGFDGTTAADPGTTGQVMEFVVGSSTLARDSSTAPENLRLTAFDPAYPTLPRIDNATSPRRVSLNEASSAAVCVSVSPTGVIQYIAGVPVSNPYDPVKFAADCAYAGGLPMGPREALLGTVDNAGVSMPLMWHEAVTENPAVGATEQWDIYNNTDDAHPIHVHLVHFKIINRQLAAFNPAFPTTKAHGISPTERGWKDTLIAYPGEITSVAATFDVQGLYVWHCHILEHEDNEMMRPYCVGHPANCPI